MHQCGHGLTGHFEIAVCHGDSGFFMRDGEMAHLRLRQHAVIDDRLVHRLERVAWNGGHVLDADLPHGVDHVVTAASLLLGALHRRRRGALQLVGERMNIGAGAGFVFACRVRDTRRRLGGGSDWGGHHSRATQGRAFQKITSAERCTRFRCACVAVGFAPLRHGRPPLF